ncbi:MAG: chromosomal replication initiator protein DnaA [Christensenellaceae bacterium]|jgi:chromosomal replication initiator protein|nr:chromosomal replication initiator protein DnaA [Christensenellaceae bacterium]
MIDINRVWSDVKTQLSVNINSIAYMMWIEPLNPHSVRNNVLILITPTLNSKTTINRNYYDIIKKALTSLYSSFSDVRFLLESEIPSDSSYSDDIHDDQLVINTSVGSVKRVCPFISKYTFSNLIEGENNELAKHAALAVSKCPGGAGDYIEFNPLFIYGGVGLGKTHLLHAIGNYLWENFPEKKVLYVPTEKMTNDYIDSISSATKSTDIKAFRKKYRSVDVLMIDDVQFLEKKAGMQDVFFHIFNELYQAGKQIVLSSDRPPKEIGTLEDRLRSRFEGGLLADIQPPGLEMRIAILKHKMLQQKIAANDEVVTFLAEQIDSNVRELEGALSKVVFYSNLLNKPSPDISIAKEALKVDTQKKDVIDPNEIINAVCSYFRIPKSDIIGKKKTKMLVEARMLAIFLITDMLSTPLVTIGQLLGGRDHTTIIHSRDKIQQKIKENKETLIQINDIKSLLSK